MDLPLGNFFEVTINSNKLFGLMDEIMARLKQHAAQLADLETSVSRTSAIVEKKSKEQSSYYDIELEKMRKSMQEEVNYMRLFMKDVDKKANEKLHDLENTVLTVKDMSIRNKHTLEDDMALKFSYIEHKMTAIAVLD
jgi:hypothetical protein